MAQQVKKPPAMQELQETRVSSLSQVDPLEEGLGTHSSVLACKMPWTEEPGGLQSIEFPRARHDLAHMVVFLTMCVCSATHLCPTLCDPMDCILPGCFLHGIFQARLMEWVAIPSSRGSSQLRD